MARQRLPLCAMVVCQFARELNELQCQWWVDVSKGEGSCSARGELRRSCAAGSIRVMSGCGMAGQWVGYHSFAEAEDVRFRRAGSTGRCNTGVKSLGWGFKLQGLTWSFVELTSHFVQIGLRVHRQIGALRKVLSQQAVGVLVRPALPRALRIAKIDVDFGR